VLGGRPWAAFIYTSLPKAKPNNNLY
jgi:hypothetical protein